MRQALESILTEMNRLLDRGKGVIDSPFHYLDPGVVAYLFQELTGLNDYPEILVQAGKAQGSGMCATLSKGEGNKAPQYLVYKAMTPELSQRVPMIQGTESLAHLEGRFARITGRLQSTRFPDGRLNLEIVFGDVRGVLFHTEEFFSSMWWPLLADDRFHELRDMVEALVYVHGPLKKTIFYHQSYGDNKEHAWVTLVPVVIGTYVESDEKQPDEF